MNNFDLVSSLQALPETDPVEVDGIQFGLSCQSACLIITNVIAVQTVCVLAITC